MIKNILILTLIIAFWGCTNLNRKHIGEWSF